MNYYRGILPVLWLLSGLASAPAAEWQWSLAVPHSRENPGVARAWLWIPPNCARVRGVVVAQHNMEEISMLENPKFRSALADLNFSEIWVAPPFDHLFRFNEGANEAFGAIINGLATESGSGSCPLPRLCPWGTRRRRVGHIILRRRIPGAPWRRCP